jgi:hypothetical protein
MSRTQASSNNCSEERVHQGDIELKAKPQGESVQLPRAAPRPAPVVAVAPTNELALSALTRANSGKTHPPERRE